MLYKPRLQVGADGVEKGKNKKVALITVCNKLLKQIFAVV